MTDWIPDDQVNRFKRRKPARRLPKKVIRQIALQSKEGGRGQCSICKEYFSMKYIIHGYKPGTFGREEMFCRDCACEQNVVRR